MVDNVEGAQRELLKYWSRMSGNRWLIAKMFGVLVCLDPKPTFCGVLCVWIQVHANSVDQMIFFLLWVLVAG